MPHPVVKSYHMVALLIVEKSSSKDIERGPLNVVLVWIFCSNHINTLSTGLSVMVSSETIGVTQIGFMNFDTVSLLNAAGEPAMHKWKLLWLSPLPSLLVTEMAEEGPPEDPPLS